MPASTRVFLQPEKKLQAGDLPACNFFFYPPQRVFSAVPCLLLPGQRDLLAGDGQLIEPLVGGVVDRVGHGGSGVLMTTSPMLLAPKGPVPS